MNRKQSEVEVLSRFIDNLNRGDSPSGDLPGLLRLAKDLKAEETRLRTWNPSPPQPQLSARPVRSRVPWWLAAAGLAAALVVIGFVAARPQQHPATIRTGKVAAPLKAALPYLAGVQIPVYLPGWLPLGPKGYYYLIQANASPHGYNVSFDFTNQPTPVNGSGMTDMAGTLGSVIAGPTAQIEKNVRQPWTRLTGTPRPISLPHGLQGQFYPNQGITWSEGGWQYEVVALGPSANSPNVVLPLVDRIITSLGPTRNPVGPGTKGYLFQDLAPDNAAITLYWTEGATSYEIWGYHAPAIRLAQSLVRVPSDLIPSRKPSAPQLKGRLDGTVVDTNGRPVRGATVWAWQPGRWQEVGTWAGAVSGTPKGTFSLSGLAEGTYEVTASLPGSVVTKPVTVKVGATPRSVTLDLSQAAKAAPGTLVIRLQDAVGNPLPHVEIRVVPANGSSVTVRTDTGGVAQVPLRSIGIYEIDVIRRGKVVATWAVPMTASRETIPLQLTDSSSIPQ